MTKDEFKEEIILRLAMFGYTVIDDEKPTLSYLMGRVRQRLLNETNLKKLPEELKYRYIDMVVGEFLTHKRMTDEESIEDLIDIDSAITQIKMGDTSIGMDKNKGSGNRNQSFESPFDELIYLLTEKGFQSDMARVRKISW